MIKRVFQFGIVIVVCAVFAAGIVHAADTTEIDNTIEELQSKISELQTEGNSLSKQITLLDSQISITTLRINSIKAAINKLSTEIDELVGEIDRLEELLTRRSELVLTRIPASYKRQVSPQFGILLLSQNVSDFILRLKYISKVQEEDAHFLFQLKATQNNFAERKALRESKKKRQVELQEQLEAESIQLDTQKQEKQSLLDQTRSSEAVYQQLLAQALAEKTALEKAIIEGVEVGPVNKGDPIALVGNSGYPACSTGAHLHFEMRKDGSWVNPEGYLASREVEDDQEGGVRSLGSGSWDWPLDGSIIVTQHFGKTPYSWRYAYSGGIHTGIDMVSRSTSIIKAPESGTLYSSSQNCGSSSIIKIKYIEHNDGVVSFYLHVQ